MLIHISMNDTIIVNVDTVKFRYKDHSKLRPPSLLRPLVLVPICNFQCKLVSSFRQVPLVVLLSGLICIVYWSYIKYQGVNCEHVHVSRFFIRQSWCDRFLSRKMIHLLFIQNILWDIYFFFLFELKLASLSGQETEANCKDL